MDLVSSYDSEPDDGLEIKNIRAASKAAESSKTVDVIQLDSDSDSDCVSTIEKKSAVTSTFPKELRMKSKPDCIDLENYDGSVDSNTSKQNEPPKLTSEKKIDYLNLECSDSDDEIENADKNMSNLMESASVLSNLPSGPPKPIEKAIEKSKFPTFHNMFEKNLSDVASASNVTTDVNSISGRNIPDFTQGNVSHDNIDSPDRKRFKGNAAILSNAQNEAEDSVTEKNGNIYREDLRSIEASQKNAVCRIPRQFIQTQIAHQSIITSLNWCIPRYSYLFLSSSLDSTIKIWDLYKAKPIQCIKSNLGLNAAKWSLDGGQIIAGGYGEKAFVVDVETGNRLVSYDIYNNVTSMEIHSYMEDVFLCGTRNAILGFDIRVNSTFPIRSFFSKCEEVLDIAFLDENEFICSTSIVSNDSSDRTIMAWDFSTGAILSNQIYLEHFTCPSLKVHPIDSIFVAQSSGNYIVSFSATKPYKKKGKIYTGHRVSSYGIECDISPDGKYIASGDAVGNVHFYNYASTNSVHCAKTGNVVTNRVKWHPCFSSTLISATHNGHIQIWK